MSKPSSHCRARRCNHDARRRIERTLDLRLNVFDMQTRRHVSRPRPRQPQVGIQPARFAPEGGARVVRRRSRTRHEIGSKSSPGGTSTSARRSGEVMTRLTDLPAQHDLPVRSPRILDGLLRADAAAGDKRRRDEDADRTHAGRALSRGPASTTFRSSR